MQKLQLIFALLIFLAACKITVNNVFEIVEENNTKEIKVYFCPKENCEKIITDNLEQAESIDCAFYSLDSDILREALNKNNARVIIENDNKEGAKGIRNVRTDNRKAIMHNKFCVINKKIVITGSFNPNKKSKTANNVIIIPSIFLAQNYEAEFNEMWQGVFGTGEKTKYPHILLNGRLIENYFCPEDECKKNLLQKLSASKESIYFMTYSFTDDDIGDLLLKKSKEITVKGIFDSTQNTDWSEYEKLKELSTLKKGVHHKVFIIDNEIIITGSYNPTRNGNENNDENLIIIQDKELAQKFIDEFYSLFNN